MNAIINGVYKNVFRLINTCTVAKEAWDILKTAHEGTSRVCMSRLQMLTTQFENLRMNEDESISEFHICVRDLENSSFTLGEKMSEEKLARKILRSLPKKFAMKVTAIEEAQDISNMKDDELIGSVQTFEMALNDRPAKKNKSVAFVSNTEEDDDQGEKDVGEIFSEALALLGRKFNKALKRLDKISSTNVMDKSLTISRTMVFNAISKMKKNQAKVEEYSIMNVKGMVISRLNVPRS